MTNVCSGYGLEAEHYTEAEAVDEAKQCTEPQTAIAAERESHLGGRK